MSSTARKIEPIVREDITVHIDKTLVPDASALGLDVTAIVEHSLAEALAAEKGKRWAEENAEAIADFNRYVEETAFRSPNTGCSSGEVRCASPR